MITVTLEPEVIALPEHSTRDALIRYVNNLLELCALISKPWLDIYSSAHTFEALCDKGIFPWPETIHARCKAIKIDEFDFFTLARTSEQIFNLLNQQESYLEEVSRIRHVCSLTCVTQPDVLQVRKNDRLKQILKQMLLIEALIINRPNNPRKNVFFLRGTETPVVRIEAEIASVDHDRADLDTGAILGKPVVCDIPVCCDPTGLNSHVVPAVIVCEHRKPEVFREMIRIELEKLNLPKKECREYVFGDSFFRLMYGLKLNEDIVKKVMLSICYTLFDEELPKVHELKVGKSAPKRIRSSDNAIAMRRDIDLYYHLHYWKLPGGCIELAKVAYPHDDFDIPE